MAAKNRRRSSDGTCLLSRPAAAPSNVGDHDSDDTDYAQTPRTLSMSLLPELAGVIPVLERYQVKEFIRSMQKQMQSGRKRRRSVSPQGCEKFTLEDMLCFQREPIPTSLLRINSVRISCGVNLFQVILKYMGVNASDRATPFSIPDQIELVTKLYKHTLEQAELRDELFAQILKQTRNNPDSYQNGAKRTRYEYGLDTCPEMAKVRPGRSGEWTALLERYLPRQIAVTWAKRDWEMDILTRYRSMEHLSKDDSRQQILRILRSLPYGNSVFFSAQKIEDPFGLLPERIILGINKRGVHFFRPVPKEFIHSAHLLDIQNFGCINASVVFRMRVAGRLHRFRFETKQGEEISEALNTHIEDAKLRRYPKTRSVADGSVHGDSTHNFKPPGLEIYEKHVQEMSKIIEETQSKTNQLLEELRGKEKRETELQDELEGVKDSLQAERQALSEVVLDRDKFRALFAEKESALQAQILERKFERECCRARVAELEKTLTERTQRLSVAESTLALKSSELDALQGSVEELENLREMKEVILLTCSFICLPCIALWEFLLDMKVKIRVYCRWRPLSEKEMLEKQKDVIAAPDEFTVEHPWKDDKQKQHQFDHVFDGSTTQEEIFEDTRIVLTALLIFWQYLVQSAVDGYNVCIFAYGQSGSGKTFTVYGSDRNPGLTPRATAELFKVLRRDSNKFSFSLKVH
ncbi:hypothetical protein KI387_028864 [Taxus chinensis]|uniref:Uncharacterized protein n=1 Tax=Taxus chinensis TaxID=29808 RepID=A0AA38CBC5_TAXCH|nr:hypothetical protein KI387_028864 [Taxus chinensis]